MAGLRLHWRAAVAARALTCLVNMQYNVIDVMHEMSCDFASPTHKKNPGCSGIAGLWVDALKRAQGFGRRIAAQVF